MLDSFSLYGQFERYRRTGDENGEAVQLTGADEDALAVREFLRKFERLDFLLLGMAEDGQCQGSRETEGVYSLEERRCVKSLVDEGEGTAYMLVGMSDCTQKSR